MRYIKISGLLLICLTFFTSLIFPVNQKAEGATPRLISTFPTANQGLISNATSIYLNFNLDVNDVDKEKVKVYLKRSASTWEEIEIKQVSPGPGSTITITPAESLIGDREYKVEVNPNSIVFQDGVSYPSWVSFTFKTNYLSFYEMMVQDERKLSNMLLNYMPREIVVSAPKRYIEEINILSKSRGKMGENPGQAVTGSVTNVDVMTKADNVDYVIIEIYKGSDRLYKVTARQVIEKDPKKQTKNDTKLFSYGFNKLPQQFDVAVAVFDRDGNKIDNKKERLVSDEENLFNKVDAKYTYKTAGNSYTLFELLGNEQLFNDLLEENEIKKLMIQVNR